jgi:toxin ParE1/3/4
MGSRVTRTPLAARDLDELAEYLRREAWLAVALRFVTSAEAACTVLAEHPHIGASLGLLGADIRRWHIDGFGNHVILYRLTDHGVEIVRILHAARDLESLFHDEPF